MPRVARVITRLNIGGPARHAFLLCKGLTHYESVLIAGSPEPSEGELVDPAVPVRHAPLVRPIRPRKDMRAYLELQRLFRTVGPDIVHTHMAKAGTLGRLAAMATRPRPVVVHTFHGHVLDGYFSRRTQDAILAIERFLGSHSDALIAVSPEIRDDLVERGIGTPDRWHVVPLGLDLSEYASLSKPSGVLRSRLKLPANVPLVGVAARLVPIKNHRLLFEAVRDLPDVHLAVLGDGPIRGDLEACARALRIGERVHFVGWWAEMAEALSDVDVVVSSSLNEGTPVAIIEALAAGRPVVATDVGGTRSVVQDGVTGLLVRSNDAVALGVAIRRLLDNPAIAETMGTTGRADVLERFTVTRMLRDVEAVYGAHVTSRPRRSK